MEAVLSHGTKTNVKNDDILQDIVAAIKTRIHTSDNLFLSKTRTLTLLAQLTEFPLGRFLLRNKGLNGYWTAYIFRNKDARYDCHPLERWLLTKSLYVMARERFHVFQAEIKKKLFNGIRCSSVPCGLMDDLLHIDYQGISDFNLVGIDVDEESLHYAKENASNQNLLNHCEFILKDAWQLELNNEFDLLVSNGLNMYESCPQRLRLLYQNFANALVCGGELLLSFIPPPPPYGLKGISQEDFLKERALFGDIIQINYLNFSTEDEIRAQLEQVGLEVKEVKYNQYGVAPVLVARKC